MKVAAAAVTAGRSVAVLKGAQAGVAPNERGDAAEVARLAGAVTASEVARFPEPLAPAAAAKRARLAPVRPPEIAEAAAKLYAERDLVVVEGRAGCWFVSTKRAAPWPTRPSSLRRRSWSWRRRAWLNTTERTARELRRRLLDLLGVVIGTWPEAPDLASRCNVAGLPNVAGAPLLGAVPARAGGAGARRRPYRAPGWLSARLFGTWDATGSGCGKRP